MLEKITPSFMMGAAGDALGAPLEGIRTLPEILDIYGNNGLSDLTSYASYFEEGKIFPVGSITDDTTMTMTTAFALLKAMDEFHPNDPRFLERLNYYSWQGYLNWAKPQVYFPKDKDFIDKDIEWDSLSHKFWWACGAGKGTLAALYQGKIGSVAQPLEYECVIEGKVLKSPNLGCGGMMRIAPYAFVQEWDDKTLFINACENAAITHGGQDAYVATGITALFVRFAAQGHNPQDIIVKTKEVLSSFEHSPLYKDGIAENLRAIDYVRSLKSEFNFSVMDSIPNDLGYKNKFLAIPVMGQTAYGIIYADHIDKVKDAIVMSANHSGDSDSVAAIVGNILGARYGTEGMIKSWVEKVALKPEIEEIAFRIQRAQLKL